MPLLHVPMRPFLHILSMALCNACEDACMLWKVVRIAMRKWQTV